MKNYETDENAGVVTYLTQADYSAGTLDFYYTSNSYHSGYGGLSASLILTDANGKTYGRSDSVSYYLETPTATLTPIKQTGIDIFEFPSYNYNFIFGDYPTRTDGMKFLATFATPVYAAGTIAFAQTVIPYRQVEQDGHFEYWSTTVTSFGLPALDGEFPYKSIGAPVFSETSIGANTIKTIVDYDSPGVLNLRAGRKYCIDDKFSMYAIYMPNGNDCIWVPLQVVNWDWGGFARYDSLGVKGWVCHNTWANHPATGQSVSVLPEWQHNIEYYLDDDNQVIVGNPPM